ncbi:malonyl-[acyl-carrier protein] O-methyltransferase BioC [Dechloromonas denitrificans]|uniref:Malonyl-[acyl-carrier protein] O-methyltransferase n=1 Tax=Dechloromonas denitrificans TaxID=281362 RepID=A0A133XLB8_9RHOO|nr:methyltransferase domain-containing protein [Dechloromonas denitrificans]KXB31696.1 malonyl-[acyl-carrier protein] O-methyltransferase BioC [Dechloromonas denitrificans]
MNAGFVDRQQVGRRFSKAAASYSEGDFFAREVDRRMQERLDYVKVEPKRILDLGCSRGASLVSLAERYPDAQLIGLDVAPAMLSAARPQRAAWQRWLGLGKSAEPVRLAADAAKLPLKTRSTAVIWSNLLLHWLDDPLPALAEAHRVLEVGGLLMFSTLGPDSLRELRLAFADGYAHTQRFIDMHDLGDMLVGCGFADPVMDMEVITLTYDDLDAVFADLRAAGSSCAMKARRHGLTGRNSWAAARAAYEGMRLDGKLPATFEVVYGHAWKAEAKQTADGRAIVRLDGLRKK